MASSSVQIEEIPDIVIGRLPVYLRALTHMAQAGKMTTSSTELGRHLGISSAQIRKDISWFGGFGKQGTGYHITYLIDQLRQILKLDQEWQVAVVGAGYLGHALAHYNGFQHRGFNIGWIFDNDSTKIGQKMNGILVQSMAELEGTIAHGDVQSVLLSVPAEVAQDITDQIVEAGVKAILSYAPINLNVPEGVQVGYSDPVAQLQHMTYYLDKGEAS
ncbi:MAG: redox-sensing transcriptional repressor Rex [Chloroflexota bacterium]